MISRSITTAVVDKHFNDEERACAIGAAIRARRRELGLSLRDVSKKSGLSIGFLSLVERGLSSLALTSLSNIAKALEMELSGFFPTAEMQDHTLALEEVKTIDNREEEERQKQKTSSTSAYISRADDASQVTLVACRRVYRMLSPRVSGLTLEPLLVTIQPGETKDEPYGHEGEEFVYVLQGELFFIVEGDEYHLGAGDSIHLRASVPHIMYNDSHQISLALWVLTPRIM